jgi:outer membrane protein assembly factor BamB
VVRSKIRRTLIWFILILFSSSCYGPKATPESIQGNDLEQIWVQDVGGILARQPFRAEDIVLVCLKDGRLLGLDATSGKVEWQFTTPYQIWSDSLGVGEKIAFLGLENNQLLGINTKNGQVQWDITLQGEVREPPLVENYSLYVTTTPQSGSDSGAMVLMLNAFDGDILWEFESREAHLSTALRNGDYLYVANTEASGTLYALASTSGELLWTHSPTGDPPQWLHTHGDKIVYASRDSQLTALKSNSGQLLWTQNLPPEVVTLSGNDNILLIATANGEIFAHQLSDGSMRWSYPTGNQPPTIVQDDPTWIENYLYFISQSGEIVALDTYSGEILFQKSTGVTPATGLTISGGWLYFPDQSGQIHAYSGKNK